MLLTREQGRHDQRFVAALYLLPLATYFVHSLATFCAIALVALGYISAGARR